MHVSSANICCSGQSIGGFQRQRYLFTDVVCKELCFDSAQKGSTGMSNAALTRDL